jgi:hypothetical protein
MTLVKLSLEAKGIYVNHKPTAVKQFLEEYSNIQDHQIVFELQDLWKAWHSKNPSYAEAQILTKRLLYVAKQLDKNFN